MNEEAVGEVGGLVSGEAGAEVQHREELVADPAEGEVAGAGRGGGVAEWETQVGTATGAGEQASVPLTRLSWTPFALPGTGMRRVVSGRFR